MFKSGTLLCQRAHTLGVYKKKKLETVEGRKAQKARSAVLEVRPWKKRGTQGGSGRGLPFPVGARGVEHKAYTG